MTKISLNLGLGLLIHPMTYSPFDFIDLLVYHNSLRLRDCLVRSIEKQFGSIRLFEDFEAIRCKLQSN